jgi:ParB-like chromosome segregation protein Spo0J
MERLALTQFDVRYRELRLHSPESMRAVRGSVTRQGVLMPLVANQLEDGTAVLLDGFKRLEVLRELGEPSAPVRFVRLSEIEAAVAMVEYNAPHRGLSALEEGWLVKRLHRTHRVPLSAIAEMLGHHKSWASRRLALVERMCPSVQDDLRLGLLHGSAARELVRLPRGNQAAVAQAVRRHGLTARQTGHLVAHYLAAPDETTRQTLLSEPDAHVAPVPAPPLRPSRLPDAWERFRELLRRLEQTALRVTGETRRWRSVSLDGRLRDELFEPVSRATSAAAEVAAELEVVGTAWGLLGQESDS